MRLPLAAVALFLLSITTVHAASPGCVEFSGARSYPAYGNPTGIAAADFNGDGFLDVAIVDYPISTLSIFLANGDGTFKAPSNITVPSAISVVATDLNADGKPDLVVNSQAAAYVFLGAGDGSFTGPSVQNTASFQPIVVADLTSDHLLDLLFANGSYFTVRTGNGDGTFATPVNHYVGSTVIAASIGDFNGDGNPDVVTSDSVSQIRISYNNGYGAFSPPVQVATGQKAIAADVNGDGKPDLVITGTNILTVLLGNGDGTFTPAGTQPLPSNAGVTVGDVNNDGKADVIAFGNNGPIDGVVSVYLGGASGIAAPQTFSVGRSPIAVTLGDFDGDGHVDLAVADFNTLGFAIVHGNGDGTFITAPRSATGGSASRITLADLDHDGVPDLIAANTLTNNVSIRFNFGNGTFLNPVTFPAGTTPLSVIAADFNHDGTIDLAVVNNGSGTVSILLGISPFNFAPAVSYPAASNPQSIAFADFNGDGNTDLAVSGNSGLTILVGNGNGTFQAPVTLPAGTSPTALAIGDFNGDHKADIAVANGASNDVSIFLGHGDATFSVTTLPLQNPAPTAIVAADLNGDGILDLATANHGADSVSILIGNGDGSFQPAIFTAAGPGPQGITAADFNGDGILDLVVVDMDDITILLGAGDGTFPTFVRYSAALTSSAAAGDLDRNGTIEIVAATESTSVEVLRNTSQCATITSVSPGAGPDAGGQTVTIAGANLSGTKYVKFGSVDAFVAGSTPTSITVTTPPHLTGSVTVNSTGAGGAASLANAYIFATADVAITKTLLTPPPYPAGGNVAYAITASNGGPDAAANVTVTDVLPSGASLVSATPSQGTCSGTTTVVCSLGTISNGGSATIALVFRTSAIPGSQTDQTSVTMSGADTNAGNNSIAAAITTIDPLSIPLFSNAMLLLIAFALALIALLRIRS